MIAIYRIQNKITNDFYVGSSLHFKQREKQHLYNLKHNKHHSSYLQNAWNKYGEENFIFEI